MNKDVNIRPLVLDDAANIAKQANNINVWNNLRDYIPYPYDVQDGINFIELVNSSETNHGFGMIYCDALVGVIGFNKQSDVYSHSAEVGYWLGEDYWGKGITSTALRQIVDYAFNEMDIKRLFTAVFEHNVGSQKVLEKLMFKKEGIGVKAVFKNGVYQNELRYSLLNPRFFPESK